MLTHDYEGGGKCSLDHPSGTDNLLVAIPCCLEGLPLVDGFPSIQYALLDTAAEWCILPGAIVRLLDLDLTPDPDTLPYCTRRGTFHGRFERLSLTLIATEGQKVEVNATFFICDWTGPIIVGWRGCLERIRFGLDPSTGMWYFASL